jgi:pyruvate dehydrogenase E1 component alpha subunit
MQAKTVPLDRSAERTGLPDRDGLVEMYRKMKLIRRFEERVNELYLQGRVPSTLHLYIGQEAVAVGVCSGLRGDDYVLSTHRPHGHSLAKGVDPKAILAELLGKATGCCKAKGGSMHVGDITKGVFPAVAIVGGNVPIAAGAGLAAKMRDSGQVVACFSGDGAANEGAWHEGLNVASIWDLPVVFVCENNLYAASTPFSLAFRVQNVADRACAYGIPGIVVDGMDVLAVYSAARQAIDRARGGGGPTLLECKTYRYCGHSRSDPRSYRTRDEEAEWEERDAISHLRRWLLGSDLAIGTELDEIDACIEATFDEALEYAEASPEPEVSELFTDLFKE